MITPGCDDRGARVRVDAENRFSRFSAITMPPPTGSEPPESEVPLPRATNGTLSRWQSGHDRDDLIGAVDHDDGFREHLE